MVKKVILDLETLKERPHAGGQSLLLARAARQHRRVRRERDAPTSPAKLHSYDIVTEKHDIIVMPGRAGRRAVASCPDRPLPTRCCVDSNRRLAVMRPSARPGEPPAVELLGPVADGPQVHLRRQAPHLHRGGAAAAAAGGEHHRVGPADGPGRRGLGPAAAGADARSGRAAHRADARGSCCPRIGPAR